MRWMYLWVLAASAAICTIAPLSPAVAASTASPPDRARIALLVYQSQSARQADLRRGDALTRGLRIKADAAEKLASTTRVQLAGARAEGAKAQKFAAALASKLEVQEKALSEAAETYAAELAKRDEEYARERSILMTTGARLLKSPEGRQALDLFNAGGEANWKEARRIMDEARKVRRALDARAAATLYNEARFKGLETTPSVISAFEEVVRDDPSNQYDWYRLAALYREQGNASKALVAAEKALGLSFDPNSEIRSKMQVGSARAAAGDPSGALRAFREAVSTARNYQSSPVEALKVLLPEALYRLGVTLDLRTHVAEAREAFQEAITLFEKIPSAQTGGAFEPYGYALLAMGDTYWLEDQPGEATTYFDKTLAVADEALGRYPGWVPARELAAEAGIAIGDILYEKGRTKDAYDRYSQAEKTYNQLLAEDPGLAWYDAKLLYLYQVLGDAELSLNKPKQALEHLERGLKISRRNQSRDFLRFLHSDLHLSGLALLSLGYEREAVERWTEALGVGDRLLAEQVSSPWEAVNQANILFDLAERWMRQGNPGEATKLLNQAEALIPRSEKLMVQSQILRLEVAKLKGEIAFARGETARSAKIYNDGLVDAERYVGANPRHKLLRFILAKLALSASKNSNPNALEQLRLAHDLLADLSVESDRTDIHESYAEAAQLMKRETSRSPTP